MRRQRLHGVDPHQFSTPDASVGAAVVVGPPGFSTIERIRKAHGGDMVAFTIDETDDCWAEYQLADCTGLKLRSRRSCPRRLSLRLAQSSQENHTKTGSALA